jgi:tetratricopeptide (TPR) repeat protein
MAWNKRAIAIAERSTDPRARRWLGSLYNNMGWTHHGAGDHEAALGFFRKALASREAEGKKDPIRVAHWCIARTLRSLGRTEEALKLQRSLLPEGTAEGDEDGFVHEELGECLLTLERAEEAKPHFAAAYRLLSHDAWLRRDEPDRLERLRRLGGAKASAASSTE